MFPSERKPLKKVFFFTNFRFTNSIFQKAFLYAQKKHIKRTRKNLNICVKIKKLKKKLCLKHNEYLKHFSTDKVYVTKPVLFPLETLNFFFGLTTTFFFHFITKQYNLHSLSASSSIVGFFCGRPLRRFVDSSPLGTSKA